VILRHGGAVHSGREAQIRQREEKPCGREEGPRAEQLDAQDARDDGINEERREGGRDVATAAREELEERLSLIRTLVYGGPRGWGAGRFQG
jgi:hypothetical protein